MPKIGERQRCADAIFAVVLAVLAGACSTPPTSAPTQAPAASDLKTFLSDVASNVRDATGSVLVQLGLARADEGDAATPAPVPPPVPARTPRRTRAAVATPAKPDPEPPHATPSPLEAEAPAAIEPVAEPVAVELPPAVNASIVYSQNDPNVQPPTRRSGVLPRWLSPGAREAAAVEVVVSPQGAVEQIKLITAPRGLTDAMELSAVKTWQFDPARKDGQPVRYRVVLATSGAPQQ